MFDIDHLYLASFNYHIEDDMGVPTPTTVFDPTEDKNLDKYYQNDLLKCLLTLLTDVDNSMHTLYKSIDNDTELLTEISDLIPETEQIKHNAFNFGTLHEQVLRRNDYITGKVGIGPFALNVTNEVLTYLYGVRFKDSAFTRSTGIDGFDKLLDIDNNYVNQWLSGFINAHVDIIKDPFISKLNTNRFTYNVISLLIRCGFGEAGVWFVSQPIIKSMAQANNIAQSQFVRDAKQYKSQYALQKAMIEDAVKEYLSDEQIEPSVLDIYTSNTDRQSVLERIRVVRAIKDKKDLYKLVAMNPTAETVEYNGVTYKVADLQRDVFYAWTVLEKYAQALNKLVQYTKIDTRKQGKNFIETAAYLYGYNQLVDPIIDDGVFDLRSIKRMVTSTWIDSKTRRAIGYQSRVLGNKTFTANEGFIYTVTRWAKQLSGSRESLSNDLLNKISRALQTAIKSNYIIGYAKTYLGHDDDYIRGLFIESNDPHHPGTMASRLNRILDAARNNPKYQRLQNNRMLSQLSVVSQEDDLVIGTNTYPKPRFIQVSSNVSNSKSAERVFTEAWLDLLNDEDKFVRSFARDMIVYSFLTSGEYNGWNKLFKYVPEKWLSGEVDTDYQSFSEFVQNTLNTDCSGYLSDDMLDEILANNFQDKTFVYPLNQIIDNETQYIISSDKNIAMLAKTSDKKDIKPYVVLRKDDYRLHNAYSVDLYKLLTTIKDTDSHGHVVYIPIYKRIQKRGYHNSDHFDIYEYGWNMNYAENWIGEPKEITELDFAKALPQLRAQYNIQSLADNSFVDAISNIDDSNINTVQGDNIAAGKRGTSDLARKLTNKYNNVTVEYKGTLFDNAEHAYQTWKSGQFDQTGFDAHGERGQAKADRNTSFQTMVEIITAKLQQHPELVQEINSRGGLAYLQASTHNVVGDAFWESSGQNGFIRALIQAYNNVTTVSNTTPQRKWIGSTKYYTRQDVANDPTTLYIFTDNTDRTSGGQSYGEGWYKEKYGEGGYGSDRNPTSAIIRGLDNAVPISTMRWFYKNHPGVTHPRTDRNSAARWHDSNFDEFKQVFDDEIQQIKDLWDTGRFRRIVSPVGDMGKSPFFGSKLTEITKERTPRIYEYMLEKFKELQEYVENSAGTNVEQTAQEQSAKMFDDETAQRMYQSWEYMEDSINTTPRTDIKTESHIVTSINDEPIDKDMGKRIYDFVESVTAIVERNSKKMVAVPYSEYKNIVDNIDRFDDIRAVLLDENYYEEKEIYGKYNKSSKSLTISEDVYDLYKMLSKNQDIMQSFADIINKTENRHYIITAEDVLVDILDDGVNLFDNVEKETENYSQLDLFQDTAYSDMTQNEQQEAEELMKRCKGGE